MLQLYENINNIITKYGNNINLLCTNNDICTKLEELYTITSINEGDKVKKHLTIIYMEGQYDENIITYINTLTNKKIKVCLIVQLHFDFSKFIKNVMVNDVEVTSWLDNGKKYEYYLIVL